MANPAPSASAPPNATSSSSGRPSPSAEPRYVVLLAVTVVGTLVGGLVTAVAVGALLSFLPAVVGVAFGLVVGFGLPLFLALRAAAGLKRRGRGLLLRRLVVMALIGAAQLAITGAVLQYSPRNTGHLAYTAFQVLDLFGGVPILSDMLYSHAEHVLPGTELKNGKNSKKTAPTKPVIGPDGGVILDAGPGSAAADGGVAAADAGAARPTPTVGAAAPKPKPGIGLSVRTPGKPARTFAAGAVTTTGDGVLIVGTIAAGGALTTRIVELGAYDKLGDPTLVECADDGTAAAILGGSHLVIARAGKTTADLQKSLEPGQKLGGAEIQSVRDVVIGAGGSGLATVDLLADGGAVTQALVVLPNGKSPAMVLRKGGDAVPGSATTATIAKSWSFKKSSGAGTVLVAETYLEGGDDVGTRMSGETFLLNPQRLLAVKLDSPKAQIEIGRTGTEPSGIEGFELQIFGDAWLLADGRTVFDANFIEKGADGWLFVAKPSGGLFALSPDLKATDKAPWHAAPPRAKYLEASAEGAVVFRREDGAAVLTSLDNPSTSSAALLGADALATDGHKIGSVESVDVPILARGGEWLIASTQLKGATGTHDAVVLASKGDVRNGKAEVLLEVGGKIPDAPPAKGAKPKDREIQSLRFFKGRDELLWQK